LKIALGGAQFGQKYGISSGQAPPSVDEVKSIINAAKNYHVDLIDTAIGYGQSQKILGSCGLEKFRVVTKIPTVPQNVMDIDGWVLDVVSRSLDELKISKLYAVMLHNPAQLVETRGKQIYRALLKVQELGLALKIGGSFYDPLSILNCINNFRLEIIQCPLNPMDRRLINTGVLDFLKDLGVEVHTRSIFLQGLLLLDPEMRPNSFSQWKDVFVGWDLWLKQNSISALEACVRFQLQFDGIDRVVVGVQSFEQLEEVVYKASLSPVDIPGYISTEDVRFINPVNWQ
jgi:aryl-alcohol dehydrogenase-like predicted oxidoreductase